MTLISPAVHKRPPIIVRFHVAQLFLVSRLLRSFYHVQKSRKHFNHSRFRRIQHNSMVPLNFAASIVTLHHITSYVGHFTRTIQLQYMDFSVLAWQFWHSIYFRERFKWHFFNTLKEVISHFWNVKWYIGKFFNENCTQIFREIGSLIIISYHILTTVS